MPPGGTSNVLQVTALLAAQLATGGRGWGGLTPALVALLAAITACALVVLRRRG